MDTTVVVINSDQMGHGNEELGRQLVAKFLHQLTGVKPPPGVVIFYNSGVRLLTSDSPVIDALHKLEHAGVDLVACGTCAEFFQLRPHIAAGRISDMREIVTLLMSAAKVVTI